jgi:hypothetical protein
MGWDLQWLTAADEDVAAAMATLRRDSRPSWVPTKRQVLVHVNQCLILWYLCIVFMVFGVRIDEYEDGHVTVADIPGMLVTAIILAAWLYGTYWLHRWSARPPSPRSRMKEWRQTLTALANGFERRPSSAATFASLITTGSRNMLEYPRFVAAGVEFGNLVSRRTGSSEWHYLAVTLPAPLPHLVLDATSNDRVGSDLPAGIDRGQRLTLEGDFDRWFRAYAPVRYGADARYVLTPDVLAALIDSAAGYNVEVVDDRLVFFTKPGADFATTPPWLSVQAALAGVAARVVSRAAAYRDERVPGQSTPRSIAAIRAELDDPSKPWVEPRPLIGAGGRRLDVRNRNKGVWPVLGAIGWFSLLTFLYAVPGIFAFAGFMSIIDGR